MIRVALRISRRVGTERLGTWEDGFFFTTTKWSVMSRELMDGFLPSRTAVVRLSVGLTLTCKPIGPAAR